VDKFAGSLFFLGGSVPSKSQEKCGEVQAPKNFGRARPSKSREAVGKSAFRDFFGPLKIAGNRGKIQILKHVHRRKITKNFWMSPSFKIPRHCGKIRILRFNLVPLKIAGNHGKIQISNPVHRGKTAKNPNFETRFKNYSKWQTLPFSSCFSSHLPPNKRCQEEAIKHNICKK
jgi:hypothetical protein